jgi:hypothetical protein
VIPCCLVTTYQRFRGKYGFHPQRRGVNHTEQSGSMYETVKVFSKSSVPFSDGNSTTVSLRVRQPDSKIYNLSPGLRDEERGVLTPSPSSVFMDWSKLTAKFYVNDTRRNTSKRPDKLKSGSKKKRTLNFG